MAPLLLASLELVHVLVFGVAPLLIAASIHQHGRARAARYARAAREAEALAGLLEGGAAATSSAALSGNQATGRLEGHDVRVSFGLRGKTRPTVQYAVEVHHPAAGFEVARDVPIRLFGRTLGAPAEGLLPGGRHVVREGGQAAGMLLQAADVGAALAKVLALPGVLLVTLRGGTLEVETEEPLEAATIRETLGALVELARLVGREPLEVAVRDGARFAWTGGDAAARCPYCKDALDAAGPEAAACERCGTVHHRECLDEAGGCTVFGCGVRAAGPAEKLQA